MTRALAETVPAAGSVSCVCAVEEPPGGNESGTSVSATSPSPSTCSWALIAFAGAAPWLVSFRSQ